MFTTVDATIFRYDSQYDHICKPQNSQNSELRNLFIKAYSPIYDIDLDIHIVLIVIPNFAMGQGDIH